MAGEIRPGETLEDKYRVGEPLNEGGFAQLYEAEPVSEEHDPGFDIVVKVLLRSATRDDAAAYDRFDREAQVAEVLNHPNTVRTVDHGKTNDGRPYLIMERLHGATLDRIRAQGAQEPARVKRILTGLLGSLAEAHSVGVVHRDLKLANIFLCPIDEPPGEMVKVIDFGLAKVLDFGSALESKTLTADGILVGTPGYMAPEVLAGGDITAAADLYVVGLIGLELLTGEAAYDGNPLAKAQAQMSANPDVPRSLIKTPLYHVVIRRLLERKPSRRFETAEDAIQALESVDLDGKPVGFLKRLFG